MTFDVVLISFNTRYLILGLKIQSSTGSRVHGLKIYLFKTSPMASIDRQSSKKRLTRLVQLKQGTLTRLFRCEFVYSAANFVTLIMSLNTLAKDDCSMKLILY